ncbi:MAG: tyrosine-type recombinase/integrase [Armatimonadetes bacterium]|nr:tyrosine-type recombinase/integrase [Armatimonadota bacterium]
MLITKMRYVDRFKDRHGHWRYYFRRPGGGRVRLPGQPGDPEFQVAHAHLLAGSAPEAQPSVIGEERTFDALREKYFASPNFLKLAPSTRYASRKAIERIIRDDKMGHRLVAGMRREDVMAVVGKRAETPGAANDALKKIRKLIRFSILLGWRKDDCTLLVESFKAGEWHTWTDDEVLAYEARWPIGSLQRTSFALLLYTGQRLSDVARMSWRDIRGGSIHVAQEKTDAKLAIPIHAELAAALSAAPRGDFVILVSGHRRAFSPKSFGNFMAKAIGRAGLPDRCVTHGVRKAAARRLAEAGCTEKEIAAITGHATLKEVARYTKAASQEKLAKAAMSKL